MERAESLSFAFVGEQLAGVACLKQPLDSYRDGVFGKAKSRTGPSDFNTELDTSRWGQNFNGAVSRRS